MDSVIDKGGEAAVNAHWNRSYLNHDGVQKLDKGTCEFVLRARPSGGMALTFIHGNSPF